MTVNMELGGMTVNDALRRTRELQQFYNTERASIQNDLAEAIIEKGGVTPYVDEFVFAMHGERYDEYNPRWQYPKEDGLSEIGTQYREVEKKYGRSLGEAVALFPDYPYNDYLYLGQIPYSLQNMAARPHITTALRYYVAKESEYRHNHSEGGRINKYIGRVILPAIALNEDRGDVREWGIELAKAQRFADEVQGEFRIDLRYEDKKLAIGRPEICDRRRVGANGEMVNDLNFLKKLDAGQRILWKAIDRADVNGHLVR